MMDNYYRNFYRTFLYEMPWRANGVNSFATHLELLRGAISSGGEVVSINPDTHKVITKLDVTYWSGSADASSVSIIVGVEINGRFCKVVLVSKNPLIPKSSPPYASDLYLEIKRDISNNSLVLSSDSVVSDGAISLWGKLVDAGNKVSVFDTSSNKYVLSPVHTSDDLLRYTGGSPQSKYIFVLDEDSISQRGNQHHVALMELKRMAGYPLTEMFDMFAKEYGETG